jgi:pimeloyl-ACP methyl ester carboxylesterase
MRRHGAAIFLLALSMAAGARAAATTCAGPPPRVHATEVAYDDVMLSVLDQGAGPVVVMIPSLGRGAGDFDDLACRVSAAGFRVIRPQPRGVEGSRGPSKGVTLRDLASDIAHVITASGAGRAVVLGHADGNRTARATAAYFPQKVSAVILLAAGGKVPAAPDIRAALRDALNTSLPDDVRLPQIAKAFFAPGHDPAVWRDGWYPDAANIEIAAGAATPLGDWWTAGSAPVLVVQADEDRIASPANATLVAQDLGARARIVHLPDAGHAMLPEQPDRIAHIVIAYLEQSRAKRD